VRAFCGAGAGHHLVRHQNVTSLIAVEDKPLRGPELAGGGPDGPRRRPDTCAGPPRCARRTKNGGVAGGTVPSGRDTALRGKLVPHLIRTTGATGWFPATAGSSVPATRS